jgi:hypothetical protein
LLALYAISGQAWAVVSPADQDRVIDKIAQILEAKYIHADVAREMVAVMEKNREDYHALTQPRMLTKRLNDDLFAVSKDHHVKVLYTDPGKDALSALFTAESNYKFVKAETLPGNIGYLRMDEFSTHKEALEVAEAALAFLANTDALIIDLRFNRGGSGDLATLMLSYFFEKPTVINRYYYRWTGKSSHYMTHKKVEGQRLVGKPLYVLTGRYTASAAEIFANTVKTFELGTLVGEKTFGIANVADLAALENGFSLLFTHGEDKNPITGTNWQGTGIMPDVTCGLDEAPARAHQLAWSRVSGVQDGTPWSARAMSALFDPVQPENLVTLAGQYGGTEFFLEDGKLLMQKANYPAYRLRPIGDGTFVLADTEGSFLLSFRTDMVITTYANGDTVQQSRDSPSGAP